MAIFKELFGGNQIPGTALGRFLITLIPNQTLRVAAQAADMTFADIMENVVDGDDNKVDKAEVTAAIIENQDDIKESFMLLIAEAFELIDIPYLDENLEKISEQYLLEQIEKNFDTIIDKLITV